MSDLEITVIVVSEFSQNCRILADSKTKEAVIIDPGAEPDRILNVLNKANYITKAIWLTHSHLDHAGGVAVIKKQLGIPLYANPIEQVMRKRMPEIAAMYGLSPQNYPACPEPDVELNGGELLKLGDIEFKVLFTPGHSPGHLCFYSEKSDTLMGGDLVFQGSVGRTDLPGGDHAVMIDSIVKHVLTLPDDTKICSGHGPDTTVGAERNTNPFFPR